MMGACAMIAVKIDSLCYNNMPKTSSWLSRIFEDKVFCTDGHQKKFLKDTDLNATLTWTNDGVNVRANWNPSDAFIIEWLETGELANLLIILRSLKDEVFVLCQE